MELSDQSCMFCGIANGKSPAQIEFQNKDVVIFWDIQPVAPIHLIVIPRKHVERLIDSTEENQKLFGQMILAAAEVAKRKDLQTGGYRLVINQGGDAGQVIDHLHMHILAGSELGPMAATPQGIVGQ